MNKETLTAYHESGHAIAFWESDFPVELVSIIPNGDQLGIVISANIIPDEVIHYLEYGCGKPDPIAIDWVETSIITDFSGAAAVKRLGKLHKKRYRYNSESSADYHQAIKLAYSWSGTQRTTDAYLKYLSFRAEDLVECRWDYIAHIATVLLEQKELNREKFEAEMEDYTLSFIK